MKIYNSEKSLENLIKEQMTASLILPISLSESKKDQFHKTISKLDPDSILENKSLAKVIESDRDDLLFGSAILASTVMNKNDDVLLPDETWKAKDTPVNTPFDEEHEFTDIIGHIFDSRVLTEDGKVYDGETAPDYFDIEVDFVVYKELFPDIAKEIIENAPKNKQFVSMEAAMKNFDYALLDDKNNIKIVKRTEATSFLTQYLRVYKGSGTYGNYRIGRVLRNFKFTGMGNVKNPANPSSKYTNIKASCIINSDIDTIDSENKFLLYNKGTIMVIENLDKAKEAIATLESEVAALKETVKASIQIAEVDKIKVDLKSKEDNLNKSISEKDTAIAELNDKLKGEASKLDVANKEISDLKASIDSIKKTLEEKTVANDYLNKSLEEYKKASKKTYRATSMKEAGASLTEAEIDKLTEMSEETFASVLSYTQSILSKKKEEDDEDKKKKDKEDLKKKQDKTSDGDDDYSNSKSKAELEGKEQEKDSADATNEIAENKDKNENMVSVASELVDILRKNNEKKVKKSKNK